MSQVIQEINPAAKIYVINIIELLYKQNLNFNLNVKIECRYQIRKYKTWQVKIIRLQYGLHD